MSIAFVLVFAAAAPFWALLIVAPNWGWTRRIASTPWMAMPPLVFWFIFAIPNFGELLPAVAKPTLEVWQGLVTEPALMTLVWAQVIAWDLFMGRWMYLDSRERNIHPLAMAPLLVLTILLSPVAVPLYLVLRQFLGRTTESTQEPAARASVPA
jgi:hypothetical protein